MIFEVLFFNEGLGGLVNINTLAVVHYLLDCIGKKPY